MSTRVIIVGGGGHAQVVADILLRCREAGQAIELIGFVDDDPVLEGRQILDRPILGALSKLEELSYDRLIVAIGSNGTRARIFQDFQRRRVDFISAIHPHSIVAPDVNLGEGVMICAGAVINTGSKIGANTIINTSSSVDHHNQIGNNCHIAPGVHLGGDVKIEDGVLIGIGATVMPRCRVGAGAIVGAGALVTKDIPPSQIVKGVPAVP